MSITICTWNINSIRLRENLVARLLKEEAPDVLCLQEAKSPLEKVPLETFKELGYTWMVGRGQKGYNGVVTLSRLPIKDAGSNDWAKLGHARHVAAQLENGLLIHNVYVPAGGDIPDREVNEKFAQKLDFINDMKNHFAEFIPKKSVLVGDLNIAPQENDVWNHKALLKIVSHTPIETEHLAALQNAAGWVDITRQNIPEGKLYSWWSYRSPEWDKADKGRRLDHIWASKDIAQHGFNSRILRSARGWNQPSDHAPVFVSFDL